jgi:hypothetical protein
MNPLQCKAFTEKGEECKRNAQVGSSYCWQHRNYVPTEKVVETKTNANTTSKLPVVPQSAAIQDFLSTWEQPIRVTYFPEDQPITIHKYDTEKEMEEFFESDIERALEVVAIEIYNSSINLFLKESDHGVDYVSIYIWPDVKSTVKFFESLKIKYPNEDFRVYGEY